jgi:hypothetical protein
MRLFAKESGVAGESVVLGLHVTGGGFSGGGFVPPSPVGWPPLELLPEPPLELLPEPPLELLPEPPPELPLPELPPSAP